MATRVPTACVFFHHGPACDIRSRTSAFRFHFFREHPVCALGSTEKGWVCNLRGASALRWPGYTCGRWKLQTTKVLWSLTTQQVMEIMGVSFICLPLIVANYSLLSFSLHIQNKLDTAIGWNTFGHPKRSSTV